jgi:peptidoglycan/LPS O-acetylase OafA/YrhL
MVETAPTPPTIGFQKNIHYLRGLAALAVLLTHTAVHIERRYEIGWYRGLFPDFLGLYGVAIFFAISGYLMARLIEEQRPTEFLARRIVRIYPALLIATVIALCVLPVAVRDAYHPIGLLLAPSNNPYFSLAVEWTLVHEIFFYVILFIIALLGLKRFVPIIAAVWLVTLLGSAAATTDFPAIGRANIYQIGFSLANTGFAAGLLIPHLLNRRQPLLYLLLAIGFAAVFNILGPRWPRFFTGISGAFLIAAATQFTFRFPSFLDTFLSKLGDWSYALYLIHITVLYTVFKAFGYNPFTLLIGIGSAMAAAAVFGEVDVAMHRQSRRLFGNSARWLTIPVLAFVALYFAAALRG